MALRPNEHAPIKIWRYTAPGHINDGMIRNNLEGINDEERWRFVPYVQEEVALQQLRAVGHSA